MENAKDEELRDAKAEAQQGNPAAKAMVASLRAGLAATVEEMKAQAEKEREERVRLAHEELQRKHGQGVQTNEEMDQELAAVIQAANGGDGQAKLEDAKAARKRAIEDRKRRLREQ